MIHFSVADGRADIRLDNPKRMNALSQKSWGELLRAIKSLHKRRDVAVLCLRGEGDLAFCAGGDITEYAALAEDAPRAAAYHDLYREVFANIRALPFASMAAIPGHCLGAGLALAACCDFRIGSPKASFGITAVRRGLVYPVTEAADLLHIAGLPALRAMILRGEKLDAKAALRVGLLDDVVPLRRLDARVDALAADCIAAAGPAYAKAKAVLLAAQQLPRESRQLRRLLLGAFDSTEFRSGTRNFLGDKLTSKKQTSPRSRRSAE